MEHGRREHEGRIRSEALHELGVVLTKEPVALAEVLDILRCEIC